MLMTIKFTMIYQYCIYLEQRIEETIRKIEYTF